MPNSIKKELESPMKVPSPEQPSKHPHHHSHGDACEHCHAIILANEIGPGQNVKRMMPPLLGVVGIGLGFLLHHLGYTTHKVAYLLAAAVAGYPIARAGFRTLVSGSGADINFLTTVAGIGALILGDWAEGAAVLTLFSIGEYLEDKAGEKTRKSIREAMELSPLEARLKIDNEFLEVSADEVVPGNTVVVFPGEKIPVDGEVVSGKSSVNQSQITGESIPVDKVSGNHVYAGSLNGEGTLDVLVTKMPEDTTLARIITMVEESQSNKAQSQRLVDEFAKYWTPVMLALSVGIAVGIPLLFRKAWQPWIYRGLAVLIVSCPCSLVISTPVTVVASIARAAKEGILIKGGVHLEALGQVKALALDKTGTITEGKVVVDKILTTKNEVVASQDLLRVAAAVESLSDHPLAKAVVKEAELRGVDYSRGEDFISIRGKGARAVLDGDEVHVGSENYMAHLGLTIPVDLAADGHGLKAKGKTLVFVAKKRRILGALALSDAVRLEAKEAISRMRDKGIKIVMLTGDDAKTAAVVADRVGIHKVKAGLMPEDKLLEIEQLISEFGSCAMLGDGVNDAPSLAAATVGIAMGEGADVALETADVALMKNDLNSLPWAVNLSRKAHRLIKQNVFFSIVVKVLALVMVFGGVLPLWLAVLSDSGAAVLVTFNGLRVLSHTH